ncbi:MAG: hypothetical protein ACREVB_05150 [Burkholderiales bacterium]
MGDDYRDDRPVRPRPRMPLDVRALVSLAERFGVPAGIAIDGELCLIRSVAEFDALLAPGAVA